MRAHHDRDWNPDYQYCDLSAAPLSYPMMPVQAGNNSVCYMYLYWFIYRSNSLQELEEGDESKNTSMKDGKFLTW